MYLILFVIARRCSASLGVPAPRSDNRNFASIIVHPHSSISQNKKQGKISSLFVFIGTRIRCFGCNPNPS